LRFDYLFISKAGFLSDAIVRSNSSLLKMKRELFVEMLNFIEHLTDIFSHCPSINKLCDVVKRRTIKFFYIWARREAPATVQKLKRTRTTTPKSKVKMSGNRDNK